MLCLTCLGAHRSTHSWGSAAACRGFSDNRADPFPGNNHVCQQLIVCQGNLTVSGNISGEIPATHQISVIKGCDSGSEKSETFGGIKEIWHERPVCTVRMLILTLIVQHLLDKLSGILSLFSSLPPVVVSEQGCSELKAP